MALFRRRGSAADPAPDSAAGIADFWQWWTTQGAADVAAAIAARDPQRQAEPLSARVAVIHPALDFELGPGRLAHHQLAITAAGDPELRATARRWLRAAPAPDAVWEYVDLRQPSDDLAGQILEIGGRRMSFDEVVVAPRRRGARVDVTAYHPLFPDVDDGTRMQLTFLALDAALGEAEVETWIGEILAATHPPLDAFALQHLRSVVTDIAAEFSGEDGSPSWSLLQGQGARGPVTVLARSVLAPVLAPDLDRHVALAVSYAQRNEGGLPVEGSLDALRDLEDHLVERLGSGGMLVAHASEAGVRTFHFYVDGAGPGEQVLKSAASGWAEGKLKVTAERDPGWRAVAPFRG